jgi:ubiquinone/menaquinone biosynthesis C-methylase UbiE
VSEGVHHPLFARLYERLAPKMEKEGAADHRRELLAGLRGRIVEVGAGTGINFAHYPEGVTEVVAVEPESYLRARAMEAARGAALSITVVDGLANSLPAEDSSFDAAVTSLVLCSVPDQAAALAEIRRVLRPGGELRFYEHVLAESPRLARLQRGMSRVWPLFAGGCHPDRETGKAIEAAGFAIEDLRRFPFRPSIVQTPVAPHILGRARLTEINP